MIKQFLLSLALLASTAHIYSSYSMDAQLFKGQKKIETKSGPTKKGSTISFTEGVEITLCEKHDTYAVVEVKITNSKCPMSPDVNECSACDCCKGCDMRCPDACQANGCCEQDCQDCNQEVYDIPYNQEFTIECPSCQYSLHITITNQ